MYERPTRTLLAGAVCLGLMSAILMSAMGATAASAQSEIPRGGGENGVPGLPAGLEFEAAYTFDYLANVAGGVETGSVYLDNLDVAATLDLDALAGWSGATMFAHGIGNQGGSASDLVGDLQGVSNIEAPNAWKLLEAWVRQDWHGGVASALVGLYDLNSEFDVIEPAGLFLNSSHGIGPDFAQTGLNGPSIFPTTAVAFRLQATLPRGLRAQFAALDAVAGDPGNPTDTIVTFHEGDGALLVAEAGWAYAEHGALTVGAFRYTAAFDVLDGSGEERGNGGAYASVQQRLHAEKRSGEEGLHAFCRWGTSASRFDQLDGYLGAGLVYRGPFAARDGDELGLAVAYAHNGDEYREFVADAGGRSETAETAWEFTYRAALRDGLSVQPVVQYVMDPGTDPALHDAWVVGSRVSLEF